MTQKKKFLFFAMFVGAIGVLIGIITMILALENFTKP